MQEPNANPTAPPAPKQVCSIRIMFPVETDEQAISYKRKVTDVLSEIPDAQIHFSLMTQPQGMPVPR